MPFFRIANTPSASIRPTSCAGLMASLWPRINGDVEHVALMAHLKHALEQAAEFLVADVARVAVHAVAAGTFDERRDLVRSHADLRKAATECRCGVSARRCAR